MSRRKQSHPRAWKATKVDNSAESGVTECEASKEQAETVESKQRESDDASDSCQQEMSSSDCIHGNTHQEEVMDDSLSCKFIEALQHATVGQTLGPISPSVCQIVTVSITESDEKSERVKPDKLLTSLRLQGTNGGEECIDFVSAADKDEAHIMINKTDHGIYVKLVKRFENTSGIRGLVVDGEPKPNEGGADVREIKQETVERLTEQPSVTSESSHNDEEQIPSVTKKCPNCSVCFRNTENLAAHQMYYCTGIDRKDPKADGPCGPKSHSVSRSASPRLFLRSPSSSSADGGSPDAPSVHVCQLCQSSFMSRQNCESHMLILHCGEHVPICKFCNFVAQSWEVLREHVFTHVKVERREDRDCEAAVDSNECTRFSEGSDGGSASDSVAATKGQFRSRMHHLHKRQGEESTAVSPTTDVDQIPSHHDKVNSKRKSTSSREMNKRTRWGDLAERRSPPDSRSSDPTNIKKFNLGEPSAAVVSATMCHACNICFRSKENYVAHKKYYCKQRHSDQQEAKEEASGSREGSPEPSRPLPTVVHKENPHSSSPLQYNDKERNILPERVDRPMKGPPHAPLMYMSSVVPSAMLVGGTQLISPNGAHLISPIFLLTPPVAIPVAGVEPSLPSPASDRLWKRKDRGDSPLDLSVRSSPSTPENIQHHPGVGEDVHDNIKVQSPRSPGSASPKKSFACSQCGVSFWKANTLIAHKQLYCSEAKKDGSSSSSRRSDERHTTHPVQSDHSSESPFRDSPSRVEVERTSNLERERHRLLSSSPHSFPIHSRHDEHLEKYFTSFHLENQIYKGLHLCSGCGVAFRKLESLEIHQKFYCQKSSSPAAVRHSPRDVGFGDRRENSSPSENHVRSPKGCNVSQMGEEERPERRHTEIHPRHTRVVDQPDDRETGVRAKPTRKERNGRQSLEIQTTRSWSPNQDMHQRARSWPTMVEQKAVDDNVPLVPEGSGLRIKIKREKNEHEFFQDKMSQSGSRENVVKANGLIQIKMEAASPRGNDCTRASASANRDKINRDTWLVNGKASRPTAYVGGVRPSDSSFLPGIKSCRSCNISFHSLSTFIAHKKYYCSSTACQRSKLPT